jgi:peroxiredoxin
MMSTAKASPIADAVARLPRSSGLPNAFQLEQEALPTGRAPDVASYLGKPLPEVPLITSTGQKTSLNGARQGFAAVVVFYRGAWCPFCNIALRTYQLNLLPALRERRIELIAVSPQLPDGSLSTQEKHGLEFAVLSDAGNQLARALGVATAPSEDARVLQLEHGLNLHERNADGSTSIPMPTVVIVDSPGLLRWIDVHPDYTTRTEPETILTALDSVGL